MLDRGAHIIVRTADGQMLHWRALSQVVDGEDFPVVWVCSELEYVEARRAGREPDAMPWPADAVQLAESVV